MNPPPHVAHPRKEKTRRKNKSASCYWPIMDGNKMFCAISRPICIFALVFPRFCGGEINSNLHIFATGQTTLWPVDFSLRPRFEEMRETQTKL
jgi:hypothetical protein